MWSPMISSTQLVPWPILQNLFCCFRISAHAAQVHMLTSCHDFHVRSWCPRSITCHNKGSTANPCAAVENYIDPAYCTCVPPSVNTTLAAHAQPRHHTVAAHPPIKEEPSRNGVTVPSVTSESACSGYSDCVSCTSNSGSIGAKMSPHPKLGFC